ncbi:isocitrate/isopropylmalate family dehydrogenase, partial [Rhodococcus ruber]
ALPGVRAMSPQMDLVVVRENTEGFYADRNMFVGSGEFMPTPDVALAVGVFTRSACERIAREAFSLADRRRRKVTIVHKT